ncbi:MAG TPA: hypothetical protein VGL19_21280, partial [Polyangiaceae bacterium]
MSVERRGPLSFLDTEWRTALWKRWVSAYLVLPEANGVAASTSPAPGATTAAAPSMPTDVADAA